MTDFEKILEQWQSYDIKSENDLDYYLDNFRILFAYNSNHIENPNTTYHDTREVFEHGTVSSFTGDLRTLFEIQNFIVPLIYEKIFVGITNKYSLVISIRKFKVYFLL